MKKKILSVFLTVAMMLSMATAFAGTISASNVDLTDGIDNYEELEAFVNSLATTDYSGVTVTLNANITVNEGWVANDGTSAVTAPTGDNAKVLDTTVESMTFKGIFEGNNHTISGLYMTGMAFFTSVEGATIQNVTFDNCVSTPQAYASNKNAAGIVVGRLTGGSLALNNVTVKNSKIVNGTTPCYVGTLVGRTESTTGTISFTNCHSVASDLYASANTSLIGGIVGCLNSADGVVNFINCSSDTDIEAFGSNNNGYKCGGIIGFCGTKTSLQGCVNTGNIKSQTMAAGMVADTSVAVTVTNCANYGDITVTTISNGNGQAGGIFGRLNNSADANNGCSITNSINTGVISATTTGTATKTICAGGMVGFAQLKRDRLTVAITNCVNYGDVESGYHGGGAIGYLYAQTVSSGDINADEIYISGFVNEGDVTAGQKAGGLVGLFEGTSGRVEKAITVGTVIGYNGTTSVNTGASCAAFGSWVQTNGADEVVFVDFFFSNATSDNVFGLWADLGTAYNNHTVSYTATGKSLDFEPGVTNAGEGSGTQKANLAIYNKFFVENGYKAVAADFYAEKGVSIFKAFNLGKDWMLTDTVPVPAGVFALLEEKTLETGNVDYIGYQTNVGELSSIRVIVGLNNLEYENTGFELYWIKAGEDGMMADMNTTTVYTSINVYDDNGNLSNPYTNEDYAYLSAIKVTFNDESLADTATTLIIKPYITVGGAKIYGDACAIVIVKDGGVVAVADHYVM